MFEYTPTLSLLKDIHKVRERISRRSKTWTFVRSLRLCLLIALILLVFATSWFYLLLRGSLPQLDGQGALAGLSAPVIVARDRLGVPTVAGANRIDVARATGFVHAQDHFFHMDLLRRQAAGELAELFGSVAVEADRTVRVHRFRARARRVVKSLRRQEQLFLEAYVAGVNAGLDALDAPPFEYLVLRDAPVRWKPEDSILVIYAMYLKLQDEGSRDSTRGVLHDMLPPPLYRFLTPRGTVWDAPLVGGPATSRLALPEPEVFDLRTRPEFAASAPQASNPTNASSLAPPGGSNNWAVAGRHTAHGGALLATDMHLGLAVPNIWYRLSIKFSNAQGQPWQVTGASLPGLPLIIVGSNGHIAWGFANSMIDSSDLVLLEPAPGKVQAYQTPPGPRRFERHQEVLHVKGDKDQILEVKSTRWGPVIDTDHRGRSRALRWVAHDLRAVNFNLQHLETATRVQQAIETANGAGMPAQNFVVADADGHIGWTIAGLIPRRFGHDGQLPQSWADGRRGWNGSLEPREYPRIIDPPNGRIWTANARVVGGDALAKLGDGGYVLGARAKQIRDALFAIDRAGERDMLAIQLDDRALFLGRWRDLLLEVLNPQAIAGDPRRREFRKHVEHWGAHAAIDSVGYRLVQSFRQHLHAQIFESLTAICREADPHFDYEWFEQTEGPLWRLVSDRPPHLLSPQFDTWQAQFLAAVDATLDEVSTDGASLQDHTWGEYNTSEIQHPLSDAIPLLGEWLNMPTIALPGDLHMPRVQAPSYGASQRMVVAPGREAQGIFHMPAGQSGHPLSPHYRDSHHAWAKGKATPFLPGPAVHTLRLVPVEHGM